MLETGREQVQCVETHMAELSRKLDTNEKMICEIMGKSRKDTMQDPQKNTEKKEKSGVRTAGAISFVFLLTLFAKLLGVVREMMQANIFIACKAGQLGSVKVPDRADERRRGKNLP